MMVPLFDGLLGMTHKEKKKGGDDTLPRHSASGTGTAVGGPESNDCGPAGHTGRRPGGRKQGPGGRGAVGMQSADEERAEGWERKGGRGTQVTGGAGVVPIPSR
jgi:hypothetical protein